MLTNVLNHFNTRKINPACLAFYVTARHILFLRVKSSGSQCLRTLKIHWPYRCKWRSNILVSSKIELEYRGKRLPLVPLRSLFIKILTIYVLLSYANYIICCDTRHLICSFSRGSLIALLDSSTYFSKMDSTCVTTYRYW